MPPALMRLGTSWILSPELENVAWYGRGPMEKYVSPIRPEKWRVHMVPFDMRKDVCG